MAKTNPKVMARAKRVSRIRKNIEGTSERPRLRVFKSNKHIYAQIIDDSLGKTLVSMSTVDKAFEMVEEKGKINAAKKVGIMIADRAKAAGIDKVVFDRGGYIYHGRVKSLSEGAREGGLIF
ncbi:MAG: 50S ribosomal protein L18 [Desulfopila sp.]|jgi:large subunit ribosomal protein L18|nr:50S ribosomal protein L18 [Desulfopila sp.]